MATVLTKKYVSGCPEDAGVDVVHAVCQVDTTETNTRVPIPFRGEFRGGLVVFAQAVSTSAAGTIDIEKTAAAGTKIAGGVTVSGTYAVGDTVSISLTADADDVNNVVDNDYLNVEMDIGDSAGDKEANVYLYFENTRYNE